MRFYFERPGSQAIKPTWGHGRYLDAWSIVHMLTGVLGGIVGIGFSLPLWQSLLAVFIVVTVYEGIEMAMNVIENLENVALDIILAVIGAGIVYWLISGWEGNTLIIAFVAVGLFNLGLLYLGWRYHLRLLLQKKKNSA